MLSAPKEDYTKSLWAVRSFARPVQPPVTDGTPVVSVQNVTAGYGAADVLKDISFDIHKRRTVAVVGESGSGKSTAARVITGLLPPRAGRGAVRRNAPAGRLPAAQPRPACARRR